MVHTHSTCAQHQRRKVLRDHMEGVRVRRAQSWVIGSQRASLALDHVAARAGRRLPISWLNMDEDSCRLDLALQRRAASRLAAGACGHPHHRRSRTRTTALHRETSTPSAGENARAPCLVSDQPGSDTRRHRQTGMTSEMKLRSGSRQWLGVPPGA